MDSPDRRRYGLVVAGAGCYACLTFVWFALPAYLSTIIDDVGLTATEAGILAGAVPLTYVPLSLFSGLVVDRVGPGRSLAAGLLVVGVAQVGRSLAPGYPSLLALTLLLGVGGTAITFGLPKLVSVLFPPARTGFPSSVYLLGSTGGTATAFAVGRPVLGPALGGWRPLFLASGLVAVGYAAVPLLLIRLSGVEAGSDGGNADVTPAALGRDLRVVLSHPELRLVVVVGTAYLALVHGLQGWLPTALEARGVPAALAGRTTGLLVVANAAGVLAVPAIADRFDRRRGAVVACGATAAVGVAALVPAAVGPATFLAVVVAGVGVGGLSPLVRAIPPDLEGIGPRLTGTAVGFVFAVGEIGGFLSPVLVGSLRDFTGSFAPGLAALAAAGLVAAAAGAAMRGA